MSLTEQAIVAAVTLVGLAAAALLVGIGVPFARALF
jgi:hypothetical protein